MSLHMTQQIASIPREKWNALIGSDHPFMNWEFLALLESSHSVGEGTGWIPYYITLTEGTTLIGATACYLKTHSYGEYVFDWSWAEAYQRYGMAYYPKLVVAAPMSPVTGPRLLIAPTAPREAVGTALIKAVHDLGVQLKVSSIHFLFTTEDDQGLLTAAGYLPREAAQYHWFNRDYQDFEQFLSALTAKQRNQIRRERRQARATGVTIEILQSDQLTADVLETMYNFYLGTHAKMASHPYLTRDFFLGLQHNFAPYTMLIMAKLHDQYVAGALFFAKGSSVYGRYWGCREQYTCLHFEICYYQPIDWCIRHGKQRFEAGAQGEHKIKRGLVPTTTRSAHWIAHLAFRTAIADFLARERTAMQEVRAYLDDRVPFKK